VTFKDVGGVPVVREARTETGCPEKSCKGAAVRLVGKKDNRPFWKCAKCGNFFNDADGKPEIREKKCKKGK
jgi:transposase-like protein